MVHRVASGLQQTSEEKLPADALRERGLLRVYLRYDRLSAAEIRYGFPAAEMLGRLGLKASQGEAALAPPSGEHRKHGRSLQTYLGVLLAFVF